MAFNYNKYKSHGDGESFWTSYSDLFLGLSSIFLLLYVVASLRNGTDSLQLQTENRDLKVKVKDLENQLQTYEEVKNNYLNTSAEKSEMEEYQELMDKLTLLQDDAKNEKEKLKRTARENELKEIALNKYQKMIRNIINANKFSKVKISNRDDVITEQDVEINTQQQKITTLNADIQTKEQQIQDREKQISGINAQLANKMKELKQTFNRAKLSQKMYQKKMQELKQQAANQVNNLKQQNNLAYGELQQAKSQLAENQNLLAATTNQLGEAQAQLSQKGKELSDMNAKLAQSAIDTQNKINALRTQANAEREGERAAFAAAMKKQKNLGAAEIARREAEFRGAMDAKEKKLAGEIQGLSNQLRSTEGQLAQVKSELEARRAVASEIQKGFKAKGIKADIDMETGDVQLDFGQAHFDNDSSLLKSEMKSILKNAMPIYSKSLFGNPKVSDKITSVEIIGFASPTYKGKFVNPESTNPEDLQALKYNMDLSYKRANSIFSYVVSDKDMQFDHRRSLVPNLKVSGRSFLDLMKADRSISSAQEYCQKNDCKKSQRVIIRFSMDKK